MRTPLSPVAKPTRCRSQPVANHEKSTHAPDAITIVSAKLQEPSIRDARKSACTLHTSNQRTREASSTRAARPAVRRHSRPMPDASESRAPEISEYLTCRRSLGYRLPYRGEFTRDQALNS